MPRYLAALLCFIWVLAWEPRAYPDGNENELTSYRCLVPDYSKTSGGSSPALSPDGKTLAYMDERRNVWIRHKAEKAGLGNVEAWKLPFEPRGLNPHFSSSDKTRSIDWTPDGKRLLFVYYPGGLYVASDVDCEARTAKVRLVAEPRPAKGETNAGEIADPRWSPDGKRIAFRRTRLRGPADVCVVEVDSGAETALANDSLGFGSAWERPWSPDGKSLVYATGRLITEKVSGDNTAHVVHRGICVISVCGKSRRLITKNGSCPSWSPRGDRIAFLEKGSFEVSQEFHGEAEVVTTVGVDGKSRKVVAPDLPTKAEVKAASATWDNTSQREFSNQFGGKLTRDQAERLRRGQMKTEEMFKIAALVTAKEIGSEFEKKIRLALRATNDQERGKLYDEATSTLPPDKALSFSKKAFGFMDQGLNEVFDLSPGNDSLPVWSPDGKRLAFVRNKSVFAGRDALIVLNLADWSQRRLFKAEEIRSVTWTRDGRSLLAQCARIMGYSRDEEGDTSHDSGYPEVWLLTLK